MEKLVEVIIENVSRASRLNTPLFLIIYYEHETAKVEFLKELLEIMTKEGLKTRTFTPIIRTEHQPLQLVSALNKASKQGEIFLLSELPRSKKSSRIDETFLGYLNLHRDELFSHRLRLILLLRHSDARQFIDAAGDLWDFRHHTYWLEEERAISPLLELAGIGIMATGLAFTQSPPYGKRKECEQHVKEVQALVNRTPRRKEKAQLLLGLTRWLLRRNMPEMAVKTAREGIDYISMDRSEIRASLEHELGYALQFTKNLPKALEHYKNSLEISKEAGEPNMEAQTHWHMAFIYQEQGRLKEAVEMLRKAVEIEKTIDHPKLEEHNKYLKKLESNLPA
jgi:tetratricopeptide (TPR) repeat protein